MGDQAVSKQRIGVFIHCASVDGAEAVKNIVEGEHSFTDLRVIRLRPKGIAARVAAVEAALTALEAEHAALVQRVSDGLEALPASTAEASVEVASVEPSEPTDEELGRMASGNVPWVLLREAERDDYRRAGRALYNLGREHGNRDRDALIRIGENAELMARRAEEEIARLKAATPARDPLRDPRAGDWFCTDWNGPWSCVRVKAVNGTPFPILIQMFRDNGQKVGLYRYDGLAGLRPMTSAEVAAFKRDGTRPTANKAQPTEAEMAAELEAAGWAQGTGTGLWYPDGRFMRGTRLADAYAAMRAGKVVT